MTTPNNSEALPPTAGSLSSVAPRTAALMLEVGRSAAKCTPRPAIWPVMTEMEVTGNKYRAAIQHEIKLAEKQIELLKLRLEQGADADAIKPFGSNLHRMVERLKAALQSPENASVEARQ